MRCIGEEIRGVWVGRMNGLWGIWDMGYMGETRHLPRTAATSPAPRTVVAVHASAWRIFRLVSPSRLFVST